MIVMMPVLPIKTVDGWEVAVECATGCLSCSYRLRNPFVTRPFRTLACREQDPTGLRRRWVCVAHDLGLCSCELYNTHPCRSKTQHFLYYALPYLNRIELNTSTLPYRLWVGLQQLPQTGK